jgi:hypothetical protein
MRYDDSVIVSSKQYKHPTMNIKVSEAKAKTAKPASTKKKVEHDNWKEVGTNKSSTTNRGLRALDLDHHRN